MHRPVRTALALAAGLIVAVTATVGLTASAALADPVVNGVTTTSFIWNCPTGTPGCAAVQTRVGDVRSGERITDACRVDRDRNAMNLIWNQTTRVGAAQRAGFLFRANLSTPGRQTTSCISGGLSTTAQADLQPRLCPFTACGGVGTIRAGMALQLFCFVDSDGQEWYLGVGHTNQQTGPLLGGFLNTDDTNGPLPVQKSCLV